MSDQEIIKGIALLPPSKNIDFDKEKWTFNFSIDFERLVNYAEKEKKWWYVFLIRKNGDEDRHLVESSFFSIKIDHKDMFFDNAGRLMMALKIRNMNMMQAPSFYYSLSTKYDIKHYAEHRNNSSGGERIPVDFRSEKAEYYEKLRLGISGINKNKINNYVHTLGSSHVVRQSGFDLDAIHGPSGNSLPSDLRGQSGGTYRRENQDDGNEIENLRKKNDELNQEITDLKSQLNTQRLQRNSDRSMENVGISADVSKLKKEVKRVEIELAAANREKENLKKGNERLQKRTSGAGLNIEEAIKRFQKENTSLLEKNQQLESKVTRKENKIRNLENDKKEKVADFEAELQKLSQNLQKKEKELHENFEREKQKALEDKKNLLNEEFKKQTDELINTLEENKTKLKAYAKLNKYEEELYDLNERIEEYQKLIPKLPQMQYLQKKDFSVLDNSTPDYKKAFLAILDWYVYFTRGPSEVSILEMPKRIPALEDAWDDLSRKFNNFIEKIEITFQQADASKIDEEFKNLLSTELGKSNNEWIEVFDKYFDGLKNYAVNQVRTVKQIEKIYFFIHPYIQLKESLGQHVEESVLFKHEVFN